MKLLWINWRKASGGIKLHAVFGAEGVKANVVSVLNFQSNGISTVKTAQNESGNTVRTNGKNICAKWPHERTW